MRGGLNHDVPFPICFWVETFYHPFGPNVILSVQSTWQFNDVYQRGIESLLRPILWFQKWTLLYTFSRWWIQSFWSGFERFLCFSFFGGVIWGEIQDSHGEPWPRHSFLDLEPFQSKYGVNDTVGKRALRTYDYLMMSCNIICLHFPEMEHGGKKQDIIFDDNERERGTGQIFVSGFELTVCFLR